MNMHTVQLTTQQWQQLTYESEIQGLTVHDYIMARLFPKPSQKSVADLVKGKQLQGFQGRSVEIQQALRDE